jgi:hypothetical protein
MAAGVLGHGAAANLENMYLEGTLQEFFPELTQDEQGLKTFLKNFSWPHAFPSHLTPDYPDVIHDGGELPSGAPCRAPGGSVERLQPQHPAAARIARAAELVQAREPVLTVDGELQGDAALLPSVARPFRPTVAPAGRHPPARAGTHRRPCPRAKAPERGAPPD